jgi:hypothetical protein
MAMSKSGVGRLVAAGLGVLLLSGVASAALAQPGDDEDVDVKVGIQQRQVPGELSMSVAGTSPHVVSLTEGAEQAAPNEARVFTGSLPQVTVSDTRLVGQIPAGVGWYVLGTATDFADDAGLLPSIPRENLGWSPSLASGTSAWVSEGTPEGTALDPTPGGGLVDQPMLVATFDSASALAEGTWTVGADLVLKTPLAVPEGAYTSILTLTLWED